jgi:hypothetical protein
MTHELTAYAVWPCGEVMPLADAHAGLNNGTLGKSDDFLAVWLTEAEAETVTYASACKMLDAIRAASFSEGEWVAQRRARAYD